MKKERVRRRLILVRHGHRDKPAPLGRKADNGLSSKGKRQAHAIARRYLKVLGEEAPSLYSSPKKRCFQTLVPLAKHFEIDISSNPNLDEQGEEESEELFLERLIEFMKAWEARKEGITLIAGHGDLFPILFEQLVGTAIELKKGGWAELEFDGSHYRLTWLLQKL